MKFLVIWIFVTVYLNLNFIGASDSQTGTFPDCHLPNNKFAKCKKLKDCPTLLKAVKDNDETRNDNRVKDHLFEYRCKEDMKKKEFCCPDFLVTYEAAPYYVYVDQNKTVTDSAPVEKPVAVDSVLTPVPIEDTTYLPAIDERVTNLVNESKSEDNLGESLASTTLQPAENTEPINKIDIDSESLPIDPTTTGFPDNQEQTTNQFESDLVDYFTRDKISEDQTTDNTQSVNEATEPIAESTTPVLDPNLVDSIFGSQSSAEDSRESNEDSKESNEDSKESEEEKPAKQNWSNNCGKSEVKKDGIYPWVVVITREKAIPCFGSIISENYILTTANCIMETENIIKMVYHHGSCTPANSTSCLQKILDVERTYIHPNYSLGNDEFNVGLFKLETPLVFNEHINSICLPENVETLTKEINFGDFSYWTPLGGIFVRNASETQLKSQKQCENSYAGVPGGFKQDNLCSAISNEIDVTKKIYYFGSPLELKLEDSRFYQFGIGLGQVADNHPLRFISVPYYIEWILSVVKRVY